MTLTTTGTVAVKKPVARVALIDLDAVTCGVLHDCFRQFGIQTVTLSDDAVPRFYKEKFEAIALRLDESAGAVLNAARTSPSNRRIVIYGISAGSRQALKYSRYGINAVLDEPVERQAALRVVRATHLLVVHELRRYVRIPIITEVALLTETRRLAAHSVEVSGGGMSVRVGARLAIGQTLQVSFDLPGKTGIKVNAAICWLHDPDGMVGLRFDPEDEHRLRVREWIDDYLEIS